jgi:hypothetical protein
VVQSGADSFRELLLSNEITAPTVLVRRSAHDRAGPYDVRVGRSSTDWDMWLRIALQVEVAYTGIPVAQYRQHDRSTSSTTARNGERLRCDVAVVEGALAAAHRLEDIEVLQRRARAALAIKALLHCRDAFLRGDSPAAFGAAALAREVRSRVAAAQAERTAEAEGYEALLRALNGEDEYGAHRASGSLLAALHSELEGTRFGERTRKAAAPPPEWRDSLDRIAAVVRRLVPAGSRVAALDKWDPTLLHLCERDGWHFPDLRRLPEGYPGGGMEAVEHLEEMRLRGAEYLVIPSSAFWWLDFYTAFREHLERSAERIWGDGLCVVFALEPAGSGAGVNGSRRPAIAGRVAS